MDRPDLVLQAEPTFEWATYQVLLSGAPLPAVDSLCHLFGSDDGVLGEQPVEHLFAVGSPEREVFASLMAASGWDAISTQGDRLRALADRSAAGRTPRQQVFLTVLSLAIDEVVTEDVPLGSAATEAGRSWEIWHDDPILAPFLARLILGLDPSPARAQALLASSSSPGARETVVKRAACYPEESLDGADPAYLTQLLQLIPADHPQLALPLAAHQGARPPASTR